MKRNKINVKDSIEMFSAYGLHAFAFNFYQIRITHLESRILYDWYHTTGSLVRYLENGSIYKAAVIRVPEDVALFINNTEYPTYENA